MYLITDMNNSVFLTGWEEPGFNNQHLATAGKYNLCKVTEKLSREALHIMHFNHRAICFI